YRKSPWAFAEQQAAEDAVRPPSGMGRYHARSAGRRCRGLKAALRDPARHDISAAMNQIPIRALALLFGLAAPLLSGCGSDDSKNKDPGPAPPVESLYKNGLDALNAHRYSAANDQFNTLEQNYPFSTWAVNAQIMQAYSQYLQNKYGDAIATLDRFIQLHPAHRDIAYIYYLRALCYYEQIGDIQRDQKGTEL